MICNDKVRFGQEKITFHPVLLILHVFEIGNIMLTIFNSSQNTIKKLLKI